MQLKENRCRGRDRNRNSCSGWHLARAEAQRRGGVFDLVIELGRAKSIVLVLSATLLVLVLERNVIAEPTFDHARLDVYRLSIDYVAFSYQLAPVRKGRWVATKGLRLRMGRDSRRGHGGVFDLAMGVGIAWCPDPNLLGNNPDGPFSANQGSCRDHRNPQEYLSFRIFVSFLFTFPLPSPLPVHPFPSTPSRPGSCQTGSVWCAGAKQALQLHTAHHLPLPSPKMQGVAPVGLTMQSRLPIIRSLLIDAGWCNGSTTGSGPVSLGSNPSPAAICFPRNTLLPRLLNRFEADPPPMFTPFVA